MKVIRVGHIAVAAEQLDAIQAVFGDLLQMPLLRTRRFDTGTEMAMYEAGNLYVEVLHNPSPNSLPGQHVQEKNGSGFFHICLEVDDFDGAVTELMAKGVKLHPQSPRKGESGGKVAFLDPTTTGGLLIELTQADDAHPH